MLIVVRVLGSGLSFWGFMFAWEEVVFGVECKYLIAILDDVGYKLGRG